MKPLRTYLSIVLVLFALSFLQGCQTTSSHMTGPELKQAAIDYLAKDSTKSTIKSALVIAGSELLQRTVETDLERTEIADQMFGLSKAFYSLATGAIVTPETFNAAIKSYAPSLSRYSQYMAVFNLAYGLIYPKLVLTGNGQLGVDYLLLMAQSAEEVAEPYRSK